ncbi:ribosomal protein L28e [Xylona heveae TC161]|uniref:Ribosomal protein L28e n=1 Tax=Xylona heveae (strain CBS 132557 / TC161) TaxID=1328760 RepID=A0A165FQY6_XYLHT|nr:ribosomal protein L28e [Xylona heveae TC161]KZF21270.1 ribosomal protein L28e [Xylona heveae TC161]
MTNVSSDLIWEITRQNNSFLFKRRGNGGIQLSRDPLNPVNKQSRKYNGFVNEKAVGVQPAEKGGVVVTTKNAKKVNTPAASYSTSTIGPNTSNRKTYKAIANITSKNSYRPDIRAEAIARASAIKLSQRPKKDAAESKPRGAKAKKTEESA